MNLQEVLQTHLGGDQQGQLVIKFNGEDHLCKISVEAGQAIYLTLGTLNPEETLGHIQHKEVEWVNFLRGLPARKRLAQPLTEQLFNIAGLPSAAATQSSDRPPAQTEGVGPSVQVDVGHINQAIEHFIDYVGPLGTMLAENIAVKLSCSCLEPMESATFEKFVAALAEEIPEIERQKFISSLRN